MTRDLRDFLNRTAVFIAASSAILVLMGHHSRSAYFERLGLSGAPLASTIQLTVSGLDLIWRPLSILALVFIAAWSVDCAKAKRIAPPPSLEQVPLLPWAAAAAWLAAGISFLELGSNLPKNFLGLTVIDVLFLLIVAAVTLPLAILPLYPKTTASQFMVGNTVSGTILVALTLMAGMTLHADLQGSDQGNDLVWGCHFYQGIRVDAPSLPLVHNKSFMLVAHEGSAFYLRPESQDRTVFIVPDSEVNTATLSIQPPRNDCDT